MSLEGRIYQFRLTKVELAELALRLTWDSFMLGKKRYLLITAGILLIIPALGGILAIGAGLTTALLSLPFFLFQALQNLTIFFLVLTVFKFLSYFWTFSRQPVSQEMRLRLENGCLYEDNVSVVHQGSSFTAFPETPGPAALKARAFPEKPLLSRPAQAPVRRTGRNPGLQSLLKRVLPL